MGARAAAREADCLRFRALKISEISPLVPRSLFVVDGPHMWTWRAGLVLDAAAREELLQPVNMIVAVNNVLFAHERAEER